MPATSIPTTPRHIAITDDTYSLHPFYQHFLQWDKTVIAPRTPAIAIAIEEGDLHMCAYGVYMAAFKQGSHAWVLSAGNQTILCESEGPSTGHPEVMSPYLAYLCCLVSSLFMINWRCVTENVADGSITIYCDNGTALNQTFNCPHPSNNPYNLLAADIKFITCAHDLLLQLPVTVHLKQEWVKGHHKG